MKPTIGRIVIYRTDGRNGISYDLPAIVTCTRDTHPGDYPDGNKNPLPVPESDTHVHLTVFTPGGYGTTITSASEAHSFGVNKEGTIYPYHEPVDSEEFKHALNMDPGSGTYVEWNVPMDDPETDDGDPDGVALRSWR